MSYKKHIPKVIGAVIVLVIGCSVSWLIYSFINTEPEQHKKTVQKITLVPPPPPPPPPEKQPPPPEVEEKVEIPEPETIEKIPDVADAPPPGELLGLDAEGGAGDSFGLIARQGGRGLLAGAGDPNVIYAAELQRLIEDALADAENGKARSKNYSIVAKIWVGFSGDITRAELATSSGDSEIDASLEALISSLPALAQAPPPNMPQPIRLRISSRL